MHNISKHSKAATVTVILQIDGQFLSYEIKDDGVGFDIALKNEVGNGLANMKSRISDIGGEFHIVSDAKAGTRIHFKVPIGIEKNNKD